MPFNRKLIKAQNNQEKFLEIQFLIENNLINAETMRFARRKLPRSNRSRNKSHHSNLASDGGAGAAGAGHSGAPHASCSNHGQPHKVDYFGTTLDAQDKFLEANADLHTLINTKLVEYLIRHVDVNTTTEDLKKQIDEAFGILDVDNSGELSTAELINGLRDFGLNPDEDELATIMNFLDTDRDGSVSFSEFSNVVMSHFEIDEVVKNHNNDLTYALSLFDPNGLDGGVFLSEKFFGCHEINIFFRPTQKLPASISTSKPTT